MSVPAVREEELEQLPATLFRTDDPAEVVVRATAIARELARVIQAQRLTSRISNREYVRVEGWTLLGSMLGVFPVCVWTRPVGDAGWEARVEARTRSGQVVGAAEAECLRSEAHWGSRDDFALRSMAQTRATSKALRLPLGFMVVLAGYDATPAEEMVPTVVDAPAHRSVATEAPGPAISAAQRRLLFARSKEVGMPEDALRGLIEELTGETSTERIPRAVFDDLLGRVGTWGAEQ